MSDRWGPRDPPKAAGIFARIPAASAWPITMFVERDLSEHRLYSILRQRKKREATGLDIVCFEIRYRFIRLLMDLLPKRYRRAVHGELLW